MEITKANLTNTEEVKNIIDLIYNVFVSCNKKNSTDKLINKMKILYGPKYDYTKTLHHLKKTPVFFVAKEHNTIVGIIRGTTDKIVNFYINKKKQGMHIGKKLLTTFETEAKKTGSNKITLKSSVYGLSFYLHYGYTIIENNILEKHL